MVATVRAGRPSEPTAEPPVDEVPGTVPTAALLGRAPEIVVFADHVTVYSTGLRAAIGVRFSPSAVPRADLGEEFLALVRNDQADAPSRIAIDLRTGAGTVSTTYPRRQHAQARHKISLLRARGGQRLWELDYWIHPRPSADITLTASWPMAGITPVPATVSYDDIAQAAQQIVPLLT